MLSGEDELIGEEHLSPSVGRAPIEAGVAEPAAGESLVVSGQTLPEAVESLERQMIAEGLRQSKGNKTRAAEALGISRRNLIRKVQAYGLEDTGKRSRR